MKIKKIIRYILIAILLCVIGFSVYNVVVIAKDFFDMEKELKQVKAEYIADESEDAKDDGGLEIKWDKLLEKNSDVIAWIDIPGTNISYPIVQGKDNNEYLRHNLDKEYSRKGSIFVDSNNLNPFKDFNTIIYGHNLMTSSMFSELKKFSDQKFVDKNNSIFLYFPDGSSSEYKIVAFHKIDARNHLEFYQTGVASKDVFLSIMKSGNQIDFNVNDEDVTSVITLSTSTNYNKNDRYVINAVLTK